MQRISRSTFSMWAVLLLACLGGLSGCASLVRRSEAIGDFGAGSLAAGRVAIVGAMLGPKVDLDRAASFPGLEGIPSSLVQGDRWAPILYREFLTSRPDVLLWPWETVTSQLPTDRLLDLHEAWGRGGVADPDLVRELGASLPGVSFLALARITENEITTRQNIETIEAEQRARDGRDVHARALDRTMNVQREVVVELEILDATTGLPVWFGEGSAHRRELFNSSDLTEATAGSGGRQEGKTRSLIDVQGSPLMAPDFDAVFGDACRALLLRLPQPDNR